VAELANTGQPAPVEIRTGADPSGTPLVTLSGEVDVSNTGALEEALTAVTAGRPERVIFDLSTLRFIDSAGLAVLLRAANRVDAVHLRNPTAAVRRVVELTGLQSILKVEP
jgi:anti-sigma B factor antagonist